MNILVIDDDESILQLVTIHLTRAGYLVLTARNAEQALELMETQSIHLVISDVMMPGMDGVAMTKVLRERYDVPVILLTARGSLEDKTRGFMAGSEDYVVKPFEPEELLFRIAAILRRTNPRYQLSLSVGNVTIHRKNFEVIVRDKTLLLPLKEFELLSILAARVNQVVPRDYLLDHVWGYASEGSEQTLNTHMKRLRHRLERAGADVVINTVRKIGYKLEVSA